MAEPGKRRATIESLAGTLVTPQGTFRGRLRMTASIREIRRDRRAARWPLLVPGFIDLHVHGGGGFDVMQGEEAVRGVARFHARHGTTALLATTVTAPREELLQAARGIAAAMRDPPPDAARILGLHLEGPFLSPEALGAQPPHAIPPDPALLEAIAAVVPLRVVTAAPEIDPGQQLAIRAKSLGFRLQIGHTRCSYAQAVAALDAGWSGFTHLFNAMSGLHHREPGAVAAALARGTWAEIIPDLVHVAPGALLAARRALPRLYGVTDATAAAGMPAGSYRLGRHRVQRFEDRVVLPDGTLAGSVLTMDRAFANLLRLGIEVAEAAGMLATLPAEYLGLEERGRLVVGAAADLVAIGPDLRIEAVWIEGRRIS